MRLLALLLIASPLFASGPKYVGSKTDPQVFQEFQNVYHDLGGSPSFISVHSFTKAELHSIAPQIVGQIYFCSDCSTDAIVVSTGTLTGAFSRVSARTTSFS